jgi:hypothetical protein
MMGSCTSPSSTTGNNLAVTPTNSQIETNVTQNPSDSSSENSASPMNTPDFSGLTSSAPETNPFVRSVEEDLANRLQIDLDQIHVLKITDIDWQDITQGCTTTGQTLIKGNPSGYRIWLEANGKNYLYHIGLDNRILFCSE